MRQWPLRRREEYEARYGDEQIVRIVRETDKDTVAEVAKRHGISEATIYAWRKKFGSLETDEVKRLKTLEAENARLRKLLVDRELEIDVMKEINAKNW
ncbi:transposase [Neopusillimonas aestuarii]|uniref:transposase n=1 Tax=Neopusillimonas aestuarii TaxID=2716226 RepID=UPI001D192B2F|nr:transposase [Pusillimonas sp. DMV24BSW_D]